MGSGCSLLKPCVSLAVDVAVFADFVALVLVPIGDEPLFFVVEATIGLEVEVDGFNGLPFGTDLDFACRASYSCFEGRFSLILIFFNPEASWSTPAVASTAVVVLDACC